MESGFEIAPRNKQQGVRGKNSDFVMVFRSSMSGLRDLTRKNPGARVVLDFIIEHMDKSNALMISRETLADVMGCSTPTIDRRIKALKDGQYLHIIKSGTSNVYILNAEVAWTTYSDKRVYAYFKTNVFASSVEQEKSVKAKISRQIKTGGSIGGGRG